MQAPASVAWPARPVLALPASKHAWRLPSPGHQLPAGQPSVVHWHVDPSANSSAEQQASCPGALYMPAAQAVHDVAREQPAALCRPAGQSAQALQSLIVAVP